jgi:regulator of replication initiation timing
MRGDEGMDIHAFKQLSILQKLDIVLAHATKLTKEKERLKANQLYNAIKDGVQLQQENQRLKELCDLPIVKTLKEHQSYKEALEHIKEKTKHGQAYHIEGEVHYIAHRALEGEGEWE